MANSGSVVESETLDQKVFVETQPRQCVMSLSRTTGKHPNMTEKIVESS